MCDERVLLNKKILLITALLSCISSAAYACMISGPHGSYSFCRQIALLGAPGTLIAAALSITLHGGAHGGGPLAELLAFSTPINFLCYAGLGLAARAVWRKLNKGNEKGNETSH